MPKVSEETLRQVEAAMNQYEQVVTISALKPHTKRTYMLHSRNFVRWLGDTFEPGEHKARQLEAEFRRQSQSQSGHRI